MERQSWDLDVISYLREKMREDFDIATNHDAVGIIERFKSWDIPPLRDDVAMMESDLENDKNYSRASSL